MKEWERLERKPYLCDGYDGDELVLIGGNYVVSRGGKFYKIDKDGNLVEKKGHVDELGYVRVSIYSKQARLHRIIATCFCENPRGCSEVNHINGVKTDNRADNLEWCTRGENISHAHRMGLKTVSKKAVEAVTRYQHNHRRFTDDQIRYIRSSNKTVRELREEFGVDHQSIRQILRRDSYKEEM